MKRYAVLVQFYAYRENQKMKLYQRKFPIYADSEKYATSMVNNILSVMEFHNFEIMDVKEV